MQNVNARTQPIFSRVEWQLSLNYGFQPDFNQTKEITKTFSSILFVSDCLINLHMEFPVKNINFGEEALLDELFLRSLGSIRLAVCLQVLFKRTNSA